MNNQNTFEHQQVAWTPTADVIEKAQLTRFMRQTGAKNFDEMYQNSIADVEEFTRQVLEFLNIEFDPPYEKLLDTSNGIEWAKWCVGGGLNITEMCVDRWAASEIKDQPAIIFESESANQGASTGVISKVFRKVFNENENRYLYSLTYKALFDEVELWAGGLRNYSLGKGDAIGIHLPMTPETIIALLAIGRIGAIAVPVFSGYGIEAITSRLNAVGAKAIFTCDHFPRRGKAVSAFDVAKKAISKVPTIKKVFISHYEGEQETIDYSELDENFVSTGYLSTVGMGIEKEKGYVEPTLAEDPLIILYTSGTTGKPKGIAHTHCGFPVKAAQDMAFGTDVGRGTRISWVTDIGWMMGPWLIYGALINGATICLYDGAPDFPEADRMWEFCAKHKVEILGISPTLVRALATKGDDLPKKHDLSALRAFASTGEPWNPAPWWWLFEKVGNSRLPIKPCSFPAPCPGIDAAILDDKGEQVERGTVGELAIRKPWIGMARGFWQEPERYLETYWSRFEGIWVHGDWALEDNEGHFYILGRSDDTLKVAGKRVGPAEVESLLVAHGSVAEAAVIGVPDEIKGTAMIAFVVLKSAETANLVAELKALVARDMGKPLAPSKIYFVNALPKTRNAKVMRRVIRAAFLGEDAGDLSALENPQTVEEIARMRVN